MNLSIREVFVNYYKISFCNEFDLSQLEFYMDVSPEWWINSSKKESIVRKYICEKFEYDCYPKIITFGRQKIDLEKNYEFKSMLLDKLISGKFDFEFLPEDEVMKENYIISNGYVSINPDKKITNSRIIIRI